MILEQYYYEKTHVHYREVKLKTSNNLDPLAALFELNFYRPTYHIPQLPQSALEENSRKHCFKYSIRLERSATSENSCCQSSASSKSSVARGAFQTLSIPFSPLAEYQCHKTGDKTVTLTEHAQVQAGSQ